MRRVCWWLRARTGSIGIRSPGPPRRAPPALGRPASCRTRPSAVSERRRHRLTPGRGSTVWWTLGISEARPPARHAGALAQNEVSVVVMGGFDPPPRAFQARALPTELHDRGAGPGTRTRIDWVTKPAPIPLGPAGTSRAALITPRHPGAVLRRRRCRAGRARAHLASSRPRMHPSRNRSQRQCVFRTDELQAVLSHGGTSFLFVREEGVEPSSQGPKPCVLPLDDSRVGGCWRGQWVPPPLLVGGSHACICQHLDPEEQ